MYTTIHHLGHDLPTAYRIQNDSDIWVRVTDRSRISLTLAEAEHLIAELTRELNAAKAEARGVVA